MRCPHCQSEQTVKNGSAIRSGQRQQRYKCRNCGKRFNERTGTPMARLRTAPELVAAAINVRSEGLGLRATGRCFDKSHTTIMGWEQRLAEQHPHWSPPAPEEGEVTLEGDEIYTRVGENLPPSQCQGWTLTFIERKSRYWVAAHAGNKDERLFTTGTEQTWQWAQAAEFIRWFTDGERRYGKALWTFASRFISKPSPHGTHYPWRKVWREGLEVAMKIKGSQGQPRVEWVKVEHPFTAISPADEVHANHNEAHNSALRRCCSAYRRRQNLYAKTVVGLQRVLEVQRLIYNWSRPHYSLGKKTTPAMAMGYCNRPISIYEILTMRGFHDITS
ncbi:MAG: IS1 family transposase [Phormidium sp. PBR-2020]|nr:MAG: IS1 family transposase [Phormidium sp. PBR-2020]